MRLALALSLTLFGFGRAAAAPTDPRLHAPTGLVITYASNPGNRPALRAVLGHAVQQRLNALRRQGLIAHYRLLWGRYADDLGWDAMLVLDLNTPKGIAGWADVEATTPGALDPVDAKLVKHIESAPVDVMQSGRDGKPGSPVYLLVPYHYLVPVGDYLKYVDGYVAPQLKGWLSERALQGYDLLLTRYPAGRPWNAMLLLQYRGDEGLGSRDATTARVRARLATDPEWKRLADSKQAIREERIATVADLIAEQ